jgi:RNA polymerase-binding transcription factor DksA
MVGTAAKTATRTRATKRRTITLETSTDGALAVREGEEPWTEPEVAEVRADLVADLDRLHREMADLQTTIQHVMRESTDGAGDDQADTGAKAYEREQELTFLAATKETIFQTQYALRRLDLQTFGSCEACGNAIGKARLQAFPRATLCVSCKQREERR